MFKDLSFFYSFCDVVGDCFLAVVKIQAPFFAQTFKTNECFVCVIKCFQELHSDFNEQKA